MNEAVRNRTASAANTLAVDVRWAEQGAVVVAAGEIDVANVEVLRRALYDAASQSDIVTVDLTDSGYIDSSTVELIVVTTRELASKRGELRIVAPARSRARRVLAISGVEDEVSLFDTTEAAAKVE